MKQINIDDLSTKVKDACNTLDKVGGINECSDEDWHAFTQTINGELARGKAYMKELDEQLKNDIAQYVNKSNEKS